MPVVEVGFLDDSRTDSDPLLRPWIILGPGWRVRFRVIEHSVQAFDTQQCLARHLNMPPGQFKGLINGEQHLTPPMDHDLAKQLMQALRRIAVESTLEESATAG